MGFIEYLCREDSQSADKAIYDQFGYMLQLSSIYPNLKTRNWRIFSYLFFALHAFYFAYYTILFAITAIKIQEDPVVFLTSAHYSILFLITLFCFIPLNLQRPRISRLYQEINKGFANYDEYLNKYKDNIKVGMKKELIIFRIIVYFLFTLNALIITVIGPVLDYYYGLSFKTVYSPYGVSLNTPVPLWSPFGSHTTARFLLTTFSEVTGALALGSVIATSNILLMGATQIITLELSLLKIALKQLQKRVNCQYKQISGNNNVEFNQIPPDALPKCYAICLKQNAKHYAKIIWCFRHVQKLCSLSMFSAFFTGGMIIAFSAVSLLFGNGHITPVLSSIALCSLEILNMFFLSWAGNTIHQSSDDLRLILYSMEWRHLRKQESLYILIMMTMAQRPLQIVAGGLIPANFRTFSEIMNTAYSFFNLMYAYRSDHSLNKY